MLLHNVIPAQPAEVIPVLNLIIEIALAGLGGRNQMAL